MNNLPAWWPGGLAIAIAMIVAVNQLIAESSKFANLLGGWGRKLHARARARYRMDTADFNEAVRDAVADERKRWEEDEARALKAVEGRLTYVTEITKAQQEEMNTLSWQIRCHTAYTEYEADWHHQLRMKIVKALKNGGAIPVEVLPEHIPFYDFERLCKDKSSFAWRTWPELQFAW